MSVAPEGREGVFTAMASAPLFLGKFVTGNIPGYWPMCLMAHKLVCPFCLSQSLGLRIQGNPFRGQLSHVLAVKCICNHKQASLTSVVHAGIICQ